MKFIDANYYTNTFKAHIDARIAGSFNNVEQHQANFEAFVETASLIVDRATGGAIYQAGGIDFIGVKGQTFIKKATAYAVEFWFLRGYNVASLDSQLALGSQSINQKVDANRLRLVIGLASVFAIQDSGMWIGTVLGASLEDALHKCGIDPRSLLTIEDALNYFAKKSEYEQNFHKDIDFASELTNDPNLDRYIKIAQTDRSKISFELMGGSDAELNKTLFMLDKDSADASKVYLYTTEPIDPEYPKYYLEYDQANPENVNIWIKVKDDIKNTHFLISNIYADDTGDYGLLGSRTNIDNTFFEIDTLNILQQANLVQLEQDIAKLEQDIETLTTAIQNVANSTTDIPQIKIDIATLKTQYAQLVSKTDTTNANVSTLTQNLASLTQRVQALEQDYVKKDGTSDLPSNYVPARPSQFANKNYVDTELKKVVSANPSIAGWEGEWSGSLAGTKPTTAPTLPLLFDLQPLVPTKGAIVLDEGKRIEITFETNGTDDNPEIMRVRSDGKLNSLEIQKASQYYYKGYLTLNGKLTLHRYLRSNDNEVDLPIGEVSITRLYQVNGVQQAGADEEIYDASILALEGVVIN